MSESTDALRQLFKQQNLFVFLGIGILASLAWIYIFYFSSVMSSQAMQPGLQDAMMPQNEKWNLYDASATFVMWSVMMIAMMLPSAMPMILVFSAVNRKRYSLGKEFVPTWIFLSGYILIWIVFSLVATSIQWALHNFAFISPEIKIVNPMLSGVILISAGIYQFTPVKQVCVKNCQSPLGFVMESWREGKLGAFIMGLHHGLFCIGCCWILMILLFVGGVMNLLWVAIIAVFVFLEKIFNVGRLLTKFAGVFFMMWGIILMTGIF